MIGKKISNAVCKILLLKKDITKNEGRLWRLYQIISLASSLLAQLSECMVMRGWDKRRLLRYKGPSLKPGGRAWSRNGPLGQASSSVLGKVNKKWQGWKMFTPSDVTHSSSVWSLPQAVFLCLHSIPQYGTPTVHLSACVEPRLMEACSYLSCLKATH